MNDQECRNAHALDGAIGADVYCSSNKQRHPRKGQGASREAQVSSLIQRVRLKYAELPRRTKSGLTFLLTLVLVPLLFFLLVLSLKLIVGAMNAEYSARGRETIRVLEDASAPLDITVYVYDIQPDKNSATVSIAINVSTDGETVENRMSCGHLTIIDRVQMERYLPHFIKVPCKNAEGWATSAFESERFNVQLLSSLEGYPNDSYWFSLDIRTYDKDGHIAANNQNVVKVAGLRIMRVEDKGENWKVTFSRPLTDIVYIYLFGAIFFFLTLIVSMAMLLGRIKSTGEEIIAVAGFLVGATGFRTILGFDRTANTTIFESVVFGVPLLILGFSALYSIVRELLSGRRAG